MNGLLIVTAAALVDTAGRILVQRRPAGKAHAGLWEFPGGKLEAGETPEASLVRELREELGLEARPESLEPLTFASVPAGTRHLVLMHFLCRDWTGTPAALDGQDLRWVDADALIDLDMPPADIPLAKQLRLWLQKGRAFSGAHPVR